MDMSGDTSIINRMDGIYNGLCSCILGRRTYLCPGTNINGKNEIITGADYGSFGIILV